jgi:hypothetical protein
VSLRTRYGTTLCNSVRTRVIARPFRAGFAGSRTLLAHFVRQSSQKGGPRSMANLCRKGLAVRPGSGAVSRSTFDASMAGRGVARLASWGSGVARGRHLCRFPRLP